ncbi:acetate--CoA ligase [bacterium]|nr:acetate--CoA ligase [bacterium]
MTTEKTIHASVFPPSPEFVAQANMQGEQTAQAFYDTSMRQGDSFWAELAKVIKFSKAPTKILDWQAPKASWFTGAELNVSENCLDKHLPHNASKTALIWEAEPKKGDEAILREVSYQELYEMTCQISNALKELGVKKGDRVLLYMPMVPEAIASMQACARIGAIHTVVFAGFSSQAIADRLQDSEAKCIITADGTYRKGNFLNLKSVVDDALDKAASKVENMLVFRRDAFQPCAIKDGRDHSWEFVEKQEKTCEAVQLDSEHPLFILYTSGTTGKPKGLYHTQAGYLLWAHWSTRWLFDIKDNDVYWCSADCGWITGHTYITYGPLSNGVTQLIYEGAPTHPSKDRFWEMIDRHKVNIFYTSPTAIRMFMGCGDALPAKHSLSTLRLLGTVGEPINPEAWLWFNKHIGHEKCPIVDTYWQTETGGVMISPFPGATATKPGSATHPLPGVDIDVVDIETGKSVGKNKKGALIIKKPWPSMARGIWGDPERFAKTYWKTSEVLDGVYLTGDMATIDEDGYVWIEGRMDDVLNISGHRIGTAEVESALITHPYIYEAAAAGVPDEVKGQAIVAFVELTDEAKVLVESGKLSVDTIKNEARETVGNEIGSFAKPREVRVAKALPKTRSGKIMRRLLRELAQNGVIKGDTTTLEDFSADSLSED